MTIHNFETLGEGVRFVDREEERRPAVEIKGRRLTPRDWAILIAIAAGAGTNAAAARAAGTSFGASMQSIETLAVAGLAAIGPPMTGRTMRSIEATDAGRTLAAALRGA